ncbi:MFS transporter [Paraburkholderia sp. ZP32-5]|uniref:MFS transporter n=1 Tax=Paraburkholderia sp. ZP32-5 TaxID=2883245 RepID=UPI001F1743C5|nr:MFS transporter [Paraburkholderia sp. ZP32-5]
MEETKTIDVQAFINEHRFSPFQWLIFAMCFVIVLMDGFDTAAIGFIAPSLLSGWQISKAALAPVLSAALLGLALGAMTAGPIADAWGRRRVLIAAVFLFGAASFVSGYASNLSELTLLRFVTGVGLGAAMPNALTVMSEFCPDGRRATIVSMMFSGFPLGAAFGGFVAAWMIPHVGWRGVLQFGGAVPLVLAILLVLLLPESIRYMVAKQHPAEKIRSVLSRISGDARFAASFTMNERIAHDRRRGGIRVVLSRSYIVGTLMLWITYFMGLVIFYGFMNWMPLLFNEAGIPAQRASMISALFPLGGVTAIFCGMLMDRLNADRVVATCYALAAVSVYAIGHALGQMGVLICSVIAAGILVSAAQASLPSLAANFYPTAGRGTGIAWMLGVGRFGGIAGSFLVAELARMQVSLPGIFAVFAGASLIAAAALWVKKMATNTASVADVPTESESLAH